MEPRTRGLAPRHRSAAAARRVVQPPFLLGAQNAAPSLADVADGLKLTGHFLAERVLIPHNREMPAARLRLEERAARESK